MGPRPRRNEGGLTRYEYTRLQDAVVQLGLKVNFYGVIGEYEHPRPSRGPDSVCSMTVMDMSFSNPGVRVLVFASSADSLPLVRSVGDIIRFHRVKMMIYKGVPQAHAIDGKSSFVLFDGKDGQGYEPYQVGNNSYSFEPQDEKIINLLRVWISTHPLGSGANKYLVPINEIEESSYFDLCCKILYIDNRDPDRRVVMFVWDGTDVRPSNILVQEVDTSMSSGENLVPNGVSIPLPPKDVLCTFPPVGSVLPVVPCISMEDLPRHLPVCGDWVKFRNVTSRASLYSLEVVFTRESKISLLAADNDTVKKCESLYHERLASDDGRLPQSSPRPAQSITVTDYEHMPYSTLREVLNFPRVTYKFRCFVRVVSTWPSELVDFSSPLNTYEAEAPDAEPVQFVYGVKLILEDPTARIPAYLYGEDAAKFFNGHPAANLLCQSATVGALQRKVQKLLGCKPALQDGNAYRDPPWIKCCIMSYYTDKQQPWESRNFRIFGTTFPG